MLSVPVNQLILLALLVAVSGYYDFRERRIPNWITIPALGWGFVLNCLPGHPGFSTALYGVLVASLVYIPLHIVRGMGAGDVTLMAAIGAIVGPQNWILIFLATSIIGGIAALALVAKRRRYYETFFNLSQLVADLLHFRAPYKNTTSLDVRSSHSLRLPHGVSIACGTVAALVLSRFHVV